MHFYQLYGLTFQSTFPISDLVELSSPEPRSDVTIQLVNDGCMSDYIPQAVAQQPIAIQINPHDALVYLQNAGVFIIQGGCKIVLVASQTAKQAQISQALLGVVLAVLLYQRGLYILHASTATIQDTAIAFLGDSGAGKSSALAAVIDQGFIGVADDLTAIQISAGHALVYAGVPQMKLSAAAAHQLQLTEKTVKTAPESTFSFCSKNHSDAVSLQHLYVLEYGPNWSIERIPQQQALIELLRFSGLKSVLPMRDRYQFTQAAKLANHVSLYRLKRPRDLQQLPKIAQFLKHHIKEYTSR
ncbi:hypothetical protein [Acaryochloris sp. IP29b_bin.148]|uniref:hypothetical protein n=1 Tax=Acaryochloris sp. IP29b_bin.148 TaxID=2969218 RepID=UPI002620B815|nr:hypothetical protein [Acaryochloris sp. IP29b_bin.148]